MNERLKELSTIAKNLTTDDAIHLSHIHNRTLSLDELGEIFAQKFAELIVEECGRVADVFCHIWCEEDKPHDVTVSNYIKRHVLRADPE
jgi:hypothetical protein